MAGIEEDVKISACMEAGDGEARLDLLGVSQGWKVRQASIRMCCGRKGVRQG